MRFDDRLKTVMMQPVADAHDRTVRWRQLVDLLSRPHEAIDAALLDAALTMVRSGVRAVARPIRAATARSIAGRAAEPRLIAIFAADKLDVAAPLLSSAQLDEEGWKLVTAAASKEVAAFIRSLRGGEEPAEPAPLSAEPASDHSADEEAHALSIGEMVARIERLKGKREPVHAPVERFEAPAPAPAPAASSTSPMLFRWECDASGQIAWVEGAPRGALIGRNIPGEEGADRSLVRAFTDRLPFDGAPLTFPAPALDGEWKLSGIPAFSPVDGRFLGYRGIARRGEEELPEEVRRGPAEGLGTDAETLRETIHEIKTPLNAIIGFAEIIDGQYLGPAHRSYRHRAAEIVSQARILLAAIEDLDFAARIQADRSQAQGEGTEFRQFFPRMAEEMTAYGADRGIGFVYQLSGQFSRCAMSPSLSERIVRRFLEGIVDSSASGESLAVSVYPDGRNCAIAVARPAALRGASEAELLNPAFTGDSGDKLGIGFALRLVRGMVRLAGGNLKIEADQLVLTMPGAR